MGRLAWCVCLCGLADIPSQPHYPGNMQPFIRCDSHGLTVNYKTHNLDQLFFVPCIGLARHSFRPRPFPLFTFRGVGSVSFCLSMVCLVKAIIVRFVFSSSVCVHYCRMEELFVQKEKLFLVYKLVWYVPPSSCLESLLFLILSFCDPYPSLPALPALPPPPPHPHPHPWFMYWYTFKHSLSLLVNC